MHPNRTCICTNVVWSVSTIDIRLMGLSLICYPYFRIRIRWLGNINFELADKMLRDIASISIDVLGKTDNGNGLMVDDISDKLEDQMCLHRLTLSSTKHQVRF